MLILFSSSRILTNKVRAFMISSAFGRFSFSSKSFCRKSKSSHNTQLARAELIRFSITDAAALVKVRQRILCGETSNSSSFKTRSVRILVLPEPAEAKTKQECIYNFINKTSFEKGGGAKRRRIYGYKLRIRSLSLSNHPSSHFVRCHPLFQRGFSNQTSFEKGGG